MPLAENIHVCHKCDQRQKGCAGPCACTVSGKNFVEHAAAGDCPEKKFSKLSLTGMVAHGIVGLVKAATGIGRADDETIARRQEICRGCPEATVTLGVVTRCAKCGCALAAKTVNADENCPLGKW